MHSKHRRYPIVLIFLIATVSLFPFPTTARQLDLEPLPPQRVDKLSEEARKSYEKGMAAIDRINYNLAKEHFTRAIEGDPDNVRLRFVLVQLAHYLGDTRKGTKSIEFYDLANANLKKIFESPHLNAREKRKAKAAIEMVRKKRQSVPERDEKRRQHGLEIAKLYAKEIFSGREEDPGRKKRKEKKKKSEFIRAQSGE